MAFAGFVDTGTVNSVLVEHLLQLKIQTASMYLHVLPATAKSITIYLQQLTGIKQEEKYQLQKHVYRALCSTSD